MSKKDASAWAQIKALLKGLPLASKSTPAISLKGYTPEQIEAMNKVVFDAEGKELDFYELEDGATIETGAKANYDGKAAEGEYMVQSEEDPEIVFTYVFEAGVLIEIKEPEVVVEDDVEEMTALKAENEALKTQLQEITAKKTETDEKNKVLNKAIMAIKKLETEKEPATATKFKQNPAAQTPKVNKVAEGITNLIKNRK